MLATSSTGTRRIVGSPLIVLPAALPGRLTRGQLDALLAQLDHRRMGPWLAVDPQERSLGGDDRLELVAEVGHPAGLAEQDGFVLGQLEIGQDRPPKPFPGRSGTLAVACPRSFAMAANVRRGSARVGAGDPGRFEAA